MRHRVLRSRWTITGLAVVATLALVALAAPWLAPGDPYHGNLSAALRAVGGVLVRHRRAGAGRVEPRPVRRPAVARRRAREPGDRPRRGARPRARRRLLRPLGRYARDARRGRDARL